MAPADMESDEKVNIPEKPFYGEMSGAQEASSSSRNTISEEEIEYPTGWRLLIIIVALILNIFLVCNLNQYILLNF
jgi:hypothetical protein